MDRSLVSRIGMLGGALFAVLVLLADFTLVPPPPQAGAAPSVITAALTANAGGLRAMGLVEAIATIFLLAFAASLASYLRESGAHPAAALLCLAGGAAAAVLNWIWCLLMVGVSVAPTAPGTIALYGTASAALAVLQFPGFVLLAACSIPAVRRGILPRWLGWSGLGAATLTLLSGIGGMLASSGPFAEYGPFALVAFLLLLAWLLSASVVLTRRTWAISVAAPAAAEGARLPGRA